jgi:hypothetical protein
MISRRLLGCLAAATTAVWGCGSGDEPAARPSAAAGEEGPHGRDPCALLTRVEAEPVLGSLTAEPYRAVKDTTVAAPSGPTCVYPTEGGRALLLTPELIYGKRFLAIERMVGGLVRQVADLPGVAADTLEGLWDEAVVGISGDLILLKGTRSLTIRYVNSSTDIAGAVRLAGPALERLAAIPEPPRPEASTEGCPLPADLVGEIVAMPVRVMYSPIQMIDACSYELVEDPTVRVELSIQPAEVGDMVFEGLKSRAQSITGEAADTIAVGDVGWAYGSSQASEAAAQAGGKVYHARLAFPLGYEEANFKDAMVKLVASMIE